MHLPDVGLTSTALIACRVLNTAIWSPEEPYAERVDNLVIEPPIFGIREERVFLGVIVESTAVFATCLPHLIAVDNAVLADNPHACIGALAKVLHALYSLTHALHKISVNDNYGRNYVDPITWGKTVGPVVSPINPDAHSPGGSGVGLFYCTP